jgi:molybdate transport system ATP-binding protein
LVGPNGAGKTTLLLLILGVLEPDRGRIVVGGRVLFDAELGVNVPIEERGLGYVPQSYALFPHLTVRQNVEFALGSRPRSSSRAARAARGREILAELGLEALAERRVTQLSGGEKQRAALARALSVRPHALLLDETLAALDVPARHEVRSFLASYLAELGIPSVLVTHDAGDARLLGQRIAVVEAGHTVQSGTWQELAQAPASAFVRQFVGAEATRHAE